MGLREIENKGQRCAQEFFERHLEFAPEPRSNYDVVDGFGKLMGW